MNLPYGRWVAGQGDGRAAQLIAGGVSNKDSSARSRAARLHAMRNGEQTNERQRENHSAPPRTKCFCHHKGVFTIEMGKAYGDT
jgi:hypothetical protein